MTTTDRQHTTDTEYRTCGTCGQEHRRDGQCELPRPTYSFLTREQLMQYEERRRALREASKAGREQAPAPFRPYGWRYGPERAGAMRLPALFWWWLLANYIGGIIYLAQINSGILQHR